MAVDASYVRALVLWAKLSPTGLADLRAEFMRLYDEAKTGNGKTLTSTTVNGKSAGWSIQMTTEQKFTAVAEALQILTRSAKTRTQASIAG
jgi:hypothetical protein